LYELILSASSAKEELEWRSRLTNQACKDQLDGYGKAFFTSLSLAIRPMGTVFGKPGTIARRISIHRATTLGPKSSLSQVIIKNTSALKDSPSSLSSTAINRSQSLLSTNRVPVLAPSRLERVRLESLLSDVWTREILPFPGMTGRARSEHLVRASASSMMRKLSVASIASNFTKRSGSLASLASLHRPVDEDHDVPSTKTPYADTHDKILHEASSVAESDNAMKSRLSVIQDEQIQSEEIIPALTNAPNGESPVGTMKRLATLRVKKGLHHDGHRIVTPPLRTSSANSLNHNRAQPNNDSPFEGSENQFETKNPRWTKGSGLNFGFSSEGLRGFFR